MPKKNAIPPEHRFEDFKTVEEFEAAIFSNAEYFTTFRLNTGRHRRDVRRFDNFPQAIADAEPDRAALVYAVTKTQRQACLDRKKWPEFLKQWDAMKKAKSKRGK